jgi:hypothetical protein
MAADITNSCLSILLIPTRTWIFIYAARNLENNNTCSETEQENKSEKLSFLTIKTLKSGLGCGEVGGEGFGHRLLSSSRRRRPALSSGGSVVTVVCSFVCVFSRG